MKKLLSLLSVLTISSSAIPTTIAASPYQKENNNNNLRETMESDSNKNKKRATEYLSRLFTKTNLGKLKNIYKPRDKKIIDKLLELNPNVPSELGTDGVLVVKNKGDNGAVIGIREPGLGAHGDRFYYDYYGTISVSFY